MAAYLYYDIRNEAFHINKRAVNYFLDCSFLCRHTWGYVMIVGGERRSPAFPLHYTTAYLY